MTDPIKEPIKPAAPDITVTSTTQTEEQLRAENGLEPENVVESPPAEKSAEQLEIDAADAELQQEVDKVEPPKADETADEKRLRQSRGTKKILTEIARRKQAEDAKTKADERADAAERELRTLRTSPTPKPTPGHKPDAPTADGTDSAPKFAFPTFDEYQETNPDADLRDFTIALNNAQWEFNTARATERHAADAAVASQRARKTTYATATTEFTAEHPDYVEALKAIVMPPDLDREKGIRDPRVDDLEDLVLKSGKDGPKVLYYLGKHPEEAARLFDAETPRELTLVFGELRYAAKTSLAAAPIPGPLTKPKPRAPAPISETPGEHKTERTLQEIAEDGEDADAYIAKVKALQRAS